MSNLMSLITILYGITMVVGCIVNVISIFLKGFVSRWNFLIGVYCLPLSIVALIICDVIAIVDFIKNCDIIRKINDVMSKPF